MKTKIPLLKDAELEQFKDEWFKIAKKYAHRLSDETHFHATYFSEEKFKLEIKENSHHNATPPFRIIFEDGRQIPQEGVYMPGSRILVAFIQEVGMDRVYGANILTTGRRNLLSKDREAIAKLAPLPLGNGWFVITKTPTSAKIKTIREIIKTCHFPASVKDNDYI